MSIGARIKEIRKYFNITAKELADATDIPVRTIGGYERNENPPNEKFLVKLIEKYNININWLLTGKGNILISLDSDLAETFANQCSLNFEDATNIINLVQNNVTRDIVLDFIKAKNGDKSSIDSLIQKLSGMKIIFS